MKNNKAKLTQQVINSYEHNDISQCTYDSYMYQLNHKECDTITVDHINKSLTTISKRFRTASI